MVIPQARETKRPVRVNAISKNMHFLTSCSATGITLFFLYPRRRRRRHVELPLSVDTTSSCAKHEQLPCLGRIRRLWVD